MKLNKQEVEHIALLARLHLTEKEKEKFTKELSQVLEYIEILNEVDTDDVEPTYQVTGLANVYREDKVVGCSEEEMKDVRGQFPESKDGLLKVPGIFE